MEPRAPNGQLYDKPRREYHQLLRRCLELSLATGRGEFARNVGFRLTSPRRQPSAEKLQRTIGFDNYVCQIVTRRRRVSRCKGWAALI